MVLEPGESPGFFISEVCTLRKAPKRLPRRDRRRGLYLGHPSVGFFFVKEFWTASCHLPDSFNISGLGPGVVFFFGVFFFISCLELHASIRHWLFVHQPLSFRSFQRENRTLSIV